MHGFCTRERLILMTDAVLKERTKDPRVEFSSSAWLPNQVIIDLFRPDCAVGELCSQFVRLGGGLRFRKAIGG